MFKAFIFGETLRYARNTNNEDDFKEKVKGFSHKLRARGYTQTEINNGTHNVSLTNRTKLIHKLPKGKQNMEAPLVFSTTYNPFVNHKDVKQAINKHCHLIQTKPTTLGNFSKTTFCCFQKSPKHSGEINPSKTHKFSPLT